MNRLRSLLMLSFVLLSPPLVRAANVSLKICNEGQINVDVATAARVPGFFSGYTWKLSGWYAIAPNTCGVVYQENYNESDPLRPSSGALIAFAISDSTGVWGAIPFKIDFADSWLKRGDGAFCVKRGVVFELHRPAGDPAADCDGIVMPVGIGFEPNCACQYTFHVGFPVTQRAAIPLGPAGKSTAPPIGAIPKAFGKGTRNAVLNGAFIVAWNFGDDRRWYYENGSLVPELFKLTGVLESPFFELSMKEEWRLRLRKGELFETFGPLEAVVKSEMRKRPGSDFVLSVGDWACGIYNERYACAYLYALDFERAELVGDAGSRSLLIPCVRGIVRGGDPLLDDLCAIHASEWKASDGPKYKIGFLGRDMDAITQTSIMLRVASDESGNIVLSALTRLAAEYKKYYEPTPVVVK